MNKPELEIELVFELAWIRKILRLGGLSSFVSGKTLFQGIYRS
jgi:hypothetical protein